MKTTSCLVTTTLIEKIKWALKAPNTVIAVERGGNGKETWSERAMEDLVSTLERRKTPFPIEAQRGVTFEKSLYTKAKFPLDQISGSDEFKNICLEIKDMEFYQKGKMNIKIDGIEENIFLYCKYDAIRETEPKLLVDIKTTKEYKSNKYLNSFQHLLYCYVSRIPIFKYIIAEWDEYPKIQKVYIENFIVDDWKGLQDRVENEIRYAFETLKEMELWDTYRDKYCLY